MEENMNPEKQISIPEGGSSNKFERLEVTPDFDGGTFTMMLSQSPEGFELETDKALPRTDEDFPYPLEDAEKARIRSNFPGQMRFTDGHIALEALNNVRSAQNQDQDTQNEAKEDFEKKRKAYLERSTVGVGIRKIRKEGNTITFDTRPVNFPVYKALADQS